MSAPCPSCGYPEAADGSRYWGAYVSGTPCPGCGYPKPLDALALRVDALEREVHDLRQQRHGGKLRRGWRALWRWLWAGIPPE